MKTVDELTDDELRAALAAREQRQNEPLPAPVMLTPELAERSAGLQRLIEAVNTIVGFLNASIPEMNTQFWLDVKATHPEIDTDKWHWVAEDGCLLPKVKSAEAPVDLVDLAAGLPPA